MTYVRMHSTRVVYLLILAAIGIAIFTRGPSPEEAAPGANVGAQAPIGYRAFNSTSYWNASVQAWPVASRSNEMIKWLQSTNPLPYMRLVGTESTGGWGEPVYWTQVTDKRYAVRATRYGLPPEFTNPGVRIPRGARPAATADGQMTIFDLSDGTVYKLHRAVYSSATDTWSAGGGSIYYLDSNGIQGKLPGSDEPRNRGHRGYPPGTHSVRYDEVLAGQISHALKITLNTSCKSPNYVWPGAGSDGDSLDANCIPQGARLRLKPSYVFPTSLPPAARVIATALQRHGVVVGDSGPSMTLKVENTVAEGRGWLWAGLLKKDSLGSIPLSAFEVIEPGYHF